MKAGNADKGPGLSGHSLSAPTAVWRGHVWGLEKDGPLKGLLLDVKKKKRKKKKKPAKTFLKVQDDGNLPLPARHDQLPGVDATIKCKVQIRPPPLDSLDKLVGCEVRFDGILSYDDGV